MSGTTQKDHTFLDVGGFIEMNCEKKMTLIIVCFSKITASKHQLRKRISFLSISLPLIE